MKAIDLYRFISENNIEWHKRENDGEQDIIIFPYTFQIEEFSKILTPTVFDRGGIECVLMDGYFAIWMKDVCEYYGIELDEVFNGEDWDSK